MAPPLAGGCLSSGQSIGVISVSHFHWHRSIQILALSFHVALMTQLRGDVRALFQWRLTLKGLKSDK
jgi:hypothetical protein